MKQKAFVLIAVLNIGIYFYLLFFAPKIETYSYEQYKNKMESTGGLSEEKIKQLSSNKEDSNYLYIDNITEFSNKYKGEIPLVEITTRLDKDINEYFKFIAEESKQKNVSKVYNDNKDGLYKFMGISQSDDLKNLLDKLKQLEDESITIIKSDVIKDSCKIEEDYTEFNLILYLSNENMIELNIKVNNFLKNQRPVLIVG